MSFVKGYLLAALFLGVGLFVVVGMLGKLMFPCAQRISLRQPSPDNKHELRMVDHYCDAPLYGSIWYTISISDTDGSSEGKEIFSADESPDLSWVNNEHVVITISGIGDIHTSLHKAGMIVVSYRLAERLHEGNFAKGMNKYEQQGMEAASKGLTPGRSPGATRKNIEFMWTRYRKLHEWALKNVENDDL
jgi:hypothetical protein